MVSVFVFRNVFMRSGCQVMGFCYVSVSGFWVYDLWFRVKVLIITFWSWVSGFGAALVCGFGLRFQKCLRSSFGASGYEFLICLCF